MLERKEGSILTVTQAYTLFSQLSMQNELQPIKRATFKQMMVDLMKNTFGINFLRRDVRDHDGKQQEGWKGIGTSVSEVPVQAPTA